MERRVFLQYLLGSMAPCTITERDTGVFIEAGKAAYWCPGVKAEELEKLRRELPKERIILDQADLSMPGFLIGAPAKKLVDLPSVARAGTTIFVEEELALLTYMNGTWFLMRS